MRSCPSFDDCHSKVVFASAIISFNFSVLSVLNGGDAQKVNPFSDSKSNLKASLASLKKVVWSYHKHPLGVKLNSVSSAPFSISQIFSFTISYVCVHHTRQTHAHTHTHTHTHTARAHTHTHSFSGILQHWLSTCFVQVTHCHHCIFQM